MNLVSISALTIAEHMLLDVDVYRAQLLLCREFLALYVAMSLHNKQSSFFLEIYLAETIIDERKAPHSGYDYRYSRRSAAEIFRSRSVPASVPFFIVREPWRAATVRLPSMCEKTMCDEPCSACSRNPSLCNMRINFLLVSCGNLGMSKRPPTMFRFWNSFKYLDARIQRD